jgi:diamine N-acetyltransferase
VDGLSIDRVKSLAADEAASIAGQMAEMEPWATLGYPSRSLAAMMQRASPERVYFVARRSDAIVAFAAIREYWLRGPYIELFVVLPAAQGQGIGRHLLTGVEDHFRPRTRNLWLSVSDFNHRAYAFYVHLGFAELARLPDVVRDGYDEILMRKRLA